MTPSHPIERVVQVHTRYRQAGGEEEVVEAERRLLEDAGIGVRQVIFDNAELRESESLGGDLGIAASTIWSRSARRLVSQAVASHRPQVVHIHNTFPAASPSVVAAGVDHEVPVVQTLHNYRLICPAATAFRDGRACTDCVGRPIPWPGVLHACVRGSRRQSAVVAAMLTLHRARRTYARDVGALIALTEFQRRLMIAGGLPHGRLHVVSNFLEPDPGEATGERSGVLFAGRLSPEKGVGTLIQAARSAPGSVVVFGAGPLERHAQEAAASGALVYAGSRPRADVLSTLRRSTALVVPSAWFEGFPLVLLEAFATGTPVITSHIGSLAEIVEDGVTGLHAQVDDPADLTSRIQWATDHPAEMRAMGAAARQRYESSYRGRRHIADLMDTYHAAAMARGGRREAVD